MSCMAARAQNSTGARMFFNGLGTANPPRRYSKSECWEAFKASDWFRKLNARSHMIAKMVLRKDNGIEFRSLAVDSLDEVFDIRNLDVTATNGARLDIDRQIFQNILHDGQSKRL